MSTKKTETTITAPTETSMVAHDYGDDAAAGWETVGKENMTIPFVVLFQALSPMVVKGEDGARSGNWYNTITKQIYAPDKGFLFLPAVVRHKFTIWTDTKEKGGKFAGLKDPEDPDVLKAIKAASKYGENVLENGHYAVDTRYVSGVICGEDGTAEAMAMLSLTSTKIRPFQLWMTRLSQVRIPDGRGGMRRPPLFSNLTRIRSKLREEGKKSWYVPEFSPADPRGLKQSLIFQDDERYVMAKACLELVTSGAVTVDYDKQQEGGEPETPRAFE